MESKICEMARHSVDPNIASLGETALHFCVAWHGDVSEEERARFAVLLLDNGARLDFRDEMLRSTLLDGHLDGDAWNC